MTNEEGFTLYLGTKVISKRHVTADDCELPYSDDTDAILKG